MDIKSPTVTKRKSASATTSKVFEAGATKNERDMVVEEYDFDEM